MIDEEEDEGDVADVVEGTEGDAIDEGDEAAEGDEGEDAEEEEEDYVDNLDENSTTVGSTFDLRFAPANQLEKSFLDKTTTKAFPGNDFHVLQSFSGIFEESALGDQKESPLPLSLSTPFQDFKLLPGMEATLKQLLKRTSKTVFESAIETNIFGFLNSYRDVWFANRTVATGQLFIQLGALHITNHVLKSMRIVAKNNARLTQIKRQRAKIMLDRKTAERELQLTSTGKKRKRSKKKNPVIEAYDKALNDIQQPEDVQDQGYTRPKVLVLLPVKNDAFKFVSTILSLIPPKAKQQVLNLKRFETEFAPGEDAGVDPTKPEDYRDLFAGNTDDAFRLGIGFNKKAVKLFTDFYASDIIVASPLGLRMIIGTEGDAERDFDFMSSIEILLMDRAEVFGMQNWEHMKVILSVLNCKPYELRETDFSRVRPWVLDGHAKYFRQNIIFSSFTTADLNALFNRHCTNSLGRVKLRPQYSGTLQAVLRQVKQVFQRVPTTSMTTMFDDRFDFFVEHVQPHLKEEEPTLLFIPSYFDYVRVRKHLKQQEIDFVSCADYTKTSMVSRARSDFFHRHKKLLLLTERFHFFRRYKIRGIYKLIFYGLPENALFYSEFCNFIHEGDHKMSLALYTKYDALTLERIVGSERSMKMLSSQNSVHLFC